MLTSGSVKTQVTGRHPRVSDSESLGYSLKICFSNKFLGDVDPAHLGSSFEVHSISGGHWVILE